MYTSPIQSSVDGDRNGFRVWEPATKKGHTLFYDHPDLLRWDWDIPVDDLGAHAYHVDTAVTLHNREAVFAYLSLGEWTKSQAWGITTSWGGVNAYCLSSPVNLARLRQRPELGKFLVREMGICRVDRHYTQNVVRALKGHSWVWVSRVWPKTWRDERWVGRFKCVWNSSNAPLDPKLVNEFEKVLSMYQVH